MSGKHNLITSLYGIIKFTWDQGSKFGAKNWDQRRKNIPGYDPDNAIQHMNHTTTTNNLTLGFRLQRW